MRSILELSDGTKYYGLSFGSNKSISGEVVFNTSMVGYVESLTDPSYKNQILVLTYPLVGNYGVPAESYTNEKLNLNWESNNIQIEGLVVSENIESNYHWKSNSTLGNWLDKFNIPGISGIDTRELTLKLREYGTMNGRIYQENTKPINFIDIGKLDLVSSVSTSQTYEINKNGKYKVLVIDCGVKHSILKQLEKRDLYLKVVNNNYDFTNDKFDALFISNGPGNPEINTELVDKLRLFMEQNPLKPIFCICLGHQLMGLAIGCNIIKMKYGNRGINQPCIDMRNGKSYITSQNHGYAIDPKTIPDDWSPLFINLNDLSNEGLIHKSKPYFSVQFHPEAKAGPSDTNFLFDMFLKKIENPTYSEMTTLHVHDLEKPSYKKVLILGSGGLSIGQAGEFDYSGSQAIKALKEENIYTVLINPNIATVQTSWDMANQVYFLPVTLEFVTEVIKKEKPDGILATFGGQTALNCLKQLHESSVLLENNVEIMGTPISTIIASEDRGIFANEMNKINQPVAISEIANNKEEATQAVEKIGFPVIIRAAYALGGLGSGFAENYDEFNNLVELAFQNSPQILIETSMRGWKEIEYEVVRDRFDNCITVCNMENFDPLGVHTGDSIVVAPSQTLTNDEYFMLRRASINIIRHLGVVGECNVQYALHPYSMKYCVIEVNARLSRSSALASKATGYPLAYVAAKLSLGYSLNQLKNSVTKKTTALFEPALDYVVVKIPRWDLKKFSGVSTEIGSSMKSVGEVMAIGRCFEETIHKAIRMANDNNYGLFPLLESLDSDIIEKLKNPSVERIFYIMKAFSKNFSISEIGRYTNIDMWFLTKLFNIYSVGNDVKNYNLNSIESDLLRKSKVFGYSDLQLSMLLDSNEYMVRNMRLKYNIKPFVKQIDTTAGEFPAETNYLYLTYSGNSHDIEFDTNGVIVLGCGAYRIGSSVEFDWCAVNCLNTLKKCNKSSIMINYNPETVSTDYDMSDRLYFEEITLERVLDIYQLEQPEGVVVSLGGQVPNNIAMDLYKNNVRILGTSPKSIDSAEDRSKFSDLLDKLDIDQPDWSVLNNINESIKFCEKVGYPTLIRPSYVLSGASMKVINNKIELENYLQNIELSNSHPVVITKFIERSKEIEVDGVAQNGKLINYAVSEHIENAGVHSGDATLVLPAQKLYLETVKRIKKITRLITKNLNISGPFNIQFLSKDNHIKVIECNLRASRSFPFVSKTYNVNFIDIATKVMLNIDFEPASVNIYDMDYVCVKAPIFSFTRLPNADPVLGVEMASTGEVACYGSDINDAFLKSMVASGFKIPKKNVLISINKVYRDYLLESLRKLKDFNIFATPTTSMFLTEHNITNTKLNYEEVFEHINSNKVELIINIPSNVDTNETAITNGFKIRRASINSGVPLITDIKLTILTISSLNYIKEHGFTYKSWNKYLN